MLRKIWDAIKSVIVVKLVLKPGDVLVVMFDQAVDPYWSASYMARFKEALPNNEVIFMRHRVVMEVLEKAE